MGGRLRAGLLVLVGALLTGCGNGLFYHPDHLNYGTPADFGEKYEDVWFTSRDGTRLHGWFVPAIGKPKATIVHFHGNAQNISAHYPFVAWLPLAGYNVFTFDYRGYGRSAGSPARQGIHDDAQAALNYIASRKNTGTPNLVILGQSLGGAVAIVAAAEHKQDIRAVIIESSFASYRGIAREKAEEVPLVGSVAGSAPSLLASEEYDPVDYIARLAPIPLMLLHGTADPVIPIAHSRLLYARAGSPKELVVLEGGGHIEAFSRFLPQTRPIVLRFLQEALSGKPAIQDGIITVSP